MSISTVNISGMTCEHCVRSVTEELTALDGVNNVEVNLNQNGISTAVITSSHELDASAIGEAVSEAGYLVVANNA